MQILLKSLFIFLTTIFFLNSCGTKKKLVYFQPNDSDSTTYNIPAFKPVFKVDDFLSITVTAEDLEATVPFNLFAAPGSNVGAGANGYTQGVPEKLGYLVDASGNVNLPVLGQVEVAGKDRQTLTKELEEKLAEYIKDPVVQIQILNFKITVLGEVGRAGTFKIPNERITLLEAIGLAGDLKITGKRKDVLVIREVNGQKQEFRVDLTSKDLFASEVYYLSQNDVVYVTPNKTSRSQSTMWRTTGGIFISLSALIVSTISVIVK